MSQSNATRGPGPHRPTILFVDDEPLLREAVARLLRRAGAEVVTAADGRHALELLRAGTRPDLILTDLNMPGLGGEELLRAVRADRSLASIPVVAVSGMPTAAPFDHYLPKPFGPAELRRALATFCPPPVLARCG